jgi:branched-chain amino acid transport system ATP-binding protein
LRYSDCGCILEDGRIVKSGATNSLRENEDMKELYLGTAGSQRGRGDRKGFNDVKSRKCWLA